MQEQRKAHEELLDRFNRRLRTLYECNSLFFQAESEQELLQSICEILVAGGELRTASIGYCEDDAEKTIRLVARSGYGPDYLGQGKLSWGEETAAGQGPFGVAVRTGKSCWVDDIRTDPRFSPWRDAALARGYSSCLAVPLLAHGKRGSVDLRGTLNLYSTECNAFDENAVEHYTALASSLTYAVSALRNRLAESLSSGVTTLRASDERKRAQEELRRSEAYLSEAQRLSHTGSFAWTVSTGETSWSEEHFRILEYDPTITPSAKHVLQRVHPEDAVLVRETVKRAARDGNDFDLEHRLLMPDGSVKYVHVVAHAISDESGECKFVGSVMDITEQHLARAALEKAIDEIKKSEDRLRLVIDTIPTMVWSALPDGCTDFVSRSWVEYYGLSLEDIERVGWEVVIHPDDVARARDKTRSAVAAGKPFEHELRCRRNDGGYRWVLHRAVPLRDEGGSIVKWFGTSNDIDDRKRAEMLLAGEKRLLEMIARGDSRALILDALCSLVEDLADGSLTSILLLDPKTNRLRHGGAPSLAASYTEKIDGAPIGPSEGSCGTAAFRAEPVIVSDIATDPLWANYRDLALAHGLRACWSTPILSSEGKVLGTFAIYYREPHIPTPQEHNLIGQITDLASIAIEREQAEEALRERARLLDLTHDTVFVRDMTDVITYWNRGAEELYGWPRAQALHKVTHELTQTVFPAPLEDINAELLRAGRWEGELIHTKRDGTKVVVSSRWSLQRDEQGLPTAILETNNDITERKRAEQALQDAQTELSHITRVTTLGEMTASIAHEMNQPLAAVITNGSACLRWLTGESPNLDEAREAAQRVIRDGNRASEIISRIRALLRKTATQKALLDINEAIQEVILLTQNEATRKRVNLRLELSADLPPVFVDRVQLQQVALNLLMNGVEAMASVDDRPREVVIRSRTDETGDVLVAVQDCGEGIDPENLEKIFNAFYSTKSQGMGMGLAISRSIVEDHGGRLWAGRNKGPGATFFFTLPPCTSQEQGIT